MPAVLEMELQMLVSCLMWVLGTKRGSSEEEAGAPNYPGSILFRIARFQGFKSCVSGWVSEQQLKLST